MAASIVLPTVQTTLQLPAEEAVMEVLGPACWRLVYWGIMNSKRKEFNTLDRAWGREERVL